MPGGPPPRPKPGIIPLRPISLGEIYDGAFQALRTNPRTMIGVSAVVIAITTLITTLPQAAALTGLGDSALFSPSRTEPVRPEDVVGPLAGLVTSLLVPSVIQALATTVVTGLLIVAVSGAVLGQRTPPGLLWQRTRGRMPALIGLAALVFLVEMALLVALILPGILVLAAGSAVAGALLLVFGGLAWFFVALPGLYLVKWSLAAPALLLEHQPVIGALRRSWTITRGSFWRVLGIQLLTVILVAVLSGIINTPFAVIGGLIGASETTPYSDFAITLTQLVVQGLGTIVAGAVFYPFQAAVTALLYIDLRMRREGLDVELIRATEGATG